MMIGNILAAVDKEKITPKEHAQVMQILEEEAEWRVQEVRGSILVMGKMVNWAGKPAMTLLRKYYPEQVRKLKVNCIC